MSTQFASRPGAVRTSIIRNSLFGRLPVFICFTATAAPVPQLKALYTEPNAPFPKHSPRVWPRISNTFPILKMWGPTLHSLPKPLERASLSLFHPPSSVYPVSSPPSRIRFQSLICCSTGDPKRKEDGTPSRVIIDLGMGQGDGESTSNALAERRSYQI